MSLTYPLPKGARQVVPDYVSDGATIVAFPIPFRFFDPTDIWVGFQPTGSTAAFVQKTLGVDYQVTGAGLEAGGVATFFLAPAAGLIRVMGLRTPSRLTSTVNDGAIISAALENELDVQEMTLQELRRDASLALATAQAALAAAGVPGAPVGIGLLNSVNAWTQANIFTKPVTAAGYYMDVTSASPLVTSFGPDGDGWILYAATSAQNYEHWHDTASRAGGLFGVSAIMLNAKGSGVNGALSPEVADFGLLVSGQKDNYLTSLIGGEIDTMIVVNAQGASGDGAGILGLAEKVKGTGSDEGGTTGIEFEQTWINSAGATLTSLHSLMAFGEAAAGGVSGGAGGFGFYTDAFNGTNYCGYYVGDFLGSDPAAGWKYLFIGAADRQVAAQYFKIVGDKVAGVAQPGDIIQGLPGKSKTIRTDTGSQWHLRNDADTADLLLVNDTGFAEVLKSLLILPATAIPAGGSTGIGYSFSSQPNFGVYFGSGVPTLAAAQGSLYLRSDGSSTSTRMYVNQNGATQWTNVTTAA